MATRPTASDTKRAVLRALLVEGLQTAKVVVDPFKLAESHGFPERVVNTYPDGIPLDLNPAWPLELDLDAETDGFLVSLSFDSRVCRCRIPYRAIGAIAVGLGGVPWEHEADTPDAIAPVPSPSRVPPPRTSTGKHLRVVK